MARAQRSRGRGTAAAFGFLLLFAGIVGAVLLYVISMRMPDRAVDEFARASVGCRTTLSFEDTGTFFVFEERTLTDTVEATTVASEASDTTGCEPSARPGQPFTFSFVDPGAAVVREDRSLEYSTDQHAGTSAYRFAISQPGRYDVVVLGDDATTVAAIGRDPEEGVSDRRRQALAVGASGVLLGLLLLLLAGRRSKQAATPSIPDGPGWGTRPDGDARAWPPVPPRVPQVPVNPQQPDTPARVAPPPPPLPARAPGATTPSASSVWAPPAAGNATPNLEPPTPSAPTRTPPPPSPTLPD